MKCQNAMIDLSTLSWVIPHHVAFLPASAGGFASYYRNRSSVSIHGLESDFATAGLTIGDLEDLLNQKRQYRFRIPLGPNRGKLWDCFGYLTGLTYDGYDGGIVAIEITGITEREKVYEVPERGDR